MRKFIFINFLKRDPKIVCVLVGNKCDMADKRVFLCINKLNKRLFLRNVDKSLLHNLKIF